MVDDKGKIMVAPLDVWTTKYSHIEDRSPGEVVDQGWGHVRFPGVLHPTLKLTLTFGAGAYPS